MAQKEEILLIYMNFAVGNVGKDEKMATKLKKIAIFFEKPIAYFSFMNYNIVKVVKSGAKCSKVVSLKGYTLPICRLSTPQKHPRLEGH